MAHRFAPLLPLPEQLVEAIDDGVDIAKKQAGINAQQQHARQRFDLVALDVAKMFTAGDLADHGDMGSAGAPQQRCERQHHPHHHTCLHAQQQDPGHGRQQRPGIAAVVAPGLLERDEVDHAHHRHNDGRRQCRHRQKGQPAGGRHQGQQQQAGGEHAGQRGIGARVIIHRRAGDTAAYHKSAGHRSGQIRRAEAEQLAIGINALPPPLRQRLRRRLAGQKNHEGDEQRGGQQRAPVVGRRHQGYVGQACRHRPHGPYFTPGPTQVNHRHCRHPQHEDRGQPGNDIGPRPSHARLRQQPGEPGFRQPQGQQRSQADRRPG